MLQLADNNIAITIEHELDARQIAFDSLLNRKLELEAELSAHGLQLKDELTEHTQQIKDEVTKGLTEHAEQSKQGLIEHATQTKDGLTEYATQTKQGLTEHVTQTKEGLTEHAKRVTEELTSLTRLANNHKEIIQNILISLRKRIDELDQRFTSSWRLFSEVRCMNITFIFQI